MNIRRPSHRWLVVDDDPALLELTTHVLRSVAGSEVVAFHEPLRALEMIFAAPESFELVVTDFNMPGLDGFELAHQIQARAPRLQVLLISGAELDSDEVTHAGVQGFLPKPYRPSQLLETVRRLLQPHHESQENPTAPLPAHCFPSAKQPPTKGSL